MWVIYTHHVQFILALITYYICERSGPIARAVTYGRHTQLREIKLGGLRLGWEVMNRLVSAPKFVTKFIKYIFASCANLQLLTKSEPQRSLYWRIGSREIKNLLPRVDERLLLHAFSLTWVPSCPLWRDVCGGSNTTHYQQDMQNCYRHSNKNWQSLRNSSYCKTTRHVKQ